MSADRDLAIYFVLPSIKGRSDISELNTVLFEIDEGTFSTVKSFLDSDSEHKADPNAVRCEKLHKDKCP
jgi:hypothetical protein